MPVTHETSHAHSICSASINCSFPNYVLPSAHPTIPRKCHLPTEAFGQYEPPPAPPTFERAKPRPSSSMDRVSTPTMVDLPLSTLPMMATRTSMGGFTLGRRRTATSAVKHCVTPPVACAEQHEGEWNRHAITCNVAQCTDGGCCTATWQWSTA